MQYLLLIPAFLFILTGAGILLLTKSSVLEWLRKDWMGLKNNIPMTYSAIANVQIWKLRMLGIFHIWLGFFITLGLVIRGIWSYLFPIIFLPLLIYAILIPVSLILYFRHQK